MSDFFGEDDSVEKNNSYIGDDDLITNTSSRLPVCLCLDISGSMKKNDAISALNEGVEAFYQAIREDEQARNSCEIAVITFNSEVKIAEEFSTVDKKGKVHFTAEGGTALAHAVNRALDLLEERKNSYKANGVDYYQPWLVIITDGKPGIRKTFRRRRAGQKNWRKKESSRCSPLPWAATTTRKNTGRSWMSSTGSATNRQNI